jgi:hypothetical protein
MSTPIEVEDRTQETMEVDINELSTAFEKFSKEAKDALIGLSNNDQIILRQTKEALEEVSSKIIFLAKKVELMSDIFEAVLLQKPEDQDRTLLKLSIDEYKALVASCQKPISS